MAGTDDGGWDPRQGGRSLWPNIGIALFVAAVYASFASVNLAGIGLSEDECLQAAGSFAYIGEDTRGYTRVHVFGLPLFNLVYMGAIKTGIYGAYLSVSGNGFDVLTWRWCGILITCAGLIGCALVAGRRLPPVVFLTAAVLTFSDLQIWVGTRHDYGPVAVALAIRMLWIAVWARSLLSGQVSGRNAFVLAFLTGFAIYEKLIAVVLLPALAVVFTVDPSRRTRRNVKLAIFGFVLGALPVIAINLWSLVTSAELRSLAMGTGEYTGHNDLGHFIVSYLGLGQGQQLWLKVFGVESTGVMTAIEAGCMAVLLLTAWAISRTRWLPVIARRGARVMLGSYVLIGIAMLIIPATRAHHWVVGTPFQYTALGFVVWGLWARRDRVSLVTQVVSTVCGLVLLSVLAMRCVTTWEAIEAERNGKHSIIYDPAITAVGLESARRAGQGVFIAINWGVGPAMFCFANGRPDHVYEPYWSNREQPISEIVEGKAAAFLVRLDLDSDARAAGTQRVLDEMAELEGWREVRPEHEFENLTGVTVRKFMPR